MNAVEFRLPKEIDSSFIVFTEEGQHFPFPWHYHPEHELVLVTESSGVRMVGDHIGNFEKGDLVFLGSWLPHLWLNEEEYYTESSTKKANAIVIHFKPDFLGDVFLNSPEMSGFRDFLTQSRRGIVLRGSAKEKIAGIMVQMPLQIGLERVSSLLAIFDILGKTTEYAFLTSPDFHLSSTSQASNRIDKIAAFVRDHYSRDIKLQEIADVANMSVTAFSRFFKQQFRRTFTEYLNEIRIGHSCKLLSNKELNVMEIAYQSGYNTLANYNRQFRKIKAMTPSEFRKRIRGRV